MLNPDEIQYVFNEPALKPGDILLMNTYEERMREKMQCQFEHVAICLGDAYLIEADGLYVVMNHIFSHAFKDVGHVEASLRTHNLYSLWLEDMNWQVTGRIANYDSATTPLSEKNLMEENVHGEIFLTGNTVHALCEQSSSNTSE